MQRSGSLAFFSLFKLDMMLPLSSTFFITTFTGRVFPAPSFPSLRICLGVAFTSIVSRKELMTSLSCSWMGMLSSTRCSLSPYMMILLALRSCSYFSINSAFRDVAIVVATLLDAVMDWEPTAAENNFLVPSDCWLFITVESFFSMSASILVSI